MIKKMAKTVADTDNTAKKQMLENKRIDIRYFSGNV